MHVLRNLSPLPVIAVTDPPTEVLVWDSVAAWSLVGGVLAALLIAAVVGKLLERSDSVAVDAAFVRRLNHRVRVWWMMAAILAIGLAIGRGGTVVLFGFVSFWALREFITMTPTRRGDHRALFWVFFIFTPLQYFLIWMGSTRPSWIRFGQGIDFYDTYSIMIPVYASLFIPARIALAGDPKRFLERSAKIVAGLLICVYCLSYAPALLDLRLHTSDGERWLGSNIGILFFLVLIAQVADVFQVAWTRLGGKRTVAEEINAGRTWEGFYGSVVTTGIIGAALWWATPFRVWEAATLSMVIAVMAFAGGMTMSAIKRDRGVTDTGTLVQGHAGVLDRIDSVCFAAPVFYHTIRFFFHA